MTETEYWAYQLTSNEVSPYSVRFEQHVLLYERGRGRQRHVQRRRLQHRDWHAEHGALVYARHVVEVQAAGKRRGVVALIAGLILT